MIWIGVVVGAVVVGVAVAWVAGRTGELAPLPSSRRDVLVPEEGPLSADDLRRVRFTLAWRGYARDEVDALLARLEAEARGRAEGARPEVAGAEGSRPEVAGAEGARADAAADDE